MNLPILVVHAYGFRRSKDGEYDLGTQSLSVCYGILGLHERFQTIIYLGGWHDHNLPNIPTSGMLMYDQAIRDGVPGHKLHTQFTLGCDYIQPPRDTMEEVNMVANLLFALGERRYRPRDIPFYAICLDFHLQRVRLLYDLCGAQCVGMIGVPLMSGKSPREKVENHLRRWQEFYGRWKTKRDPGGKSQFFQQLRHKRTHLGRTRYRKLVSPNDWDFQPDRPKSRQG